jgi:hypothetical protein
LNEEQKSISTIAVNIRLISDENFAWIKAQSVVMRELQRYVDAHDSIFDLQAAVEGLLGGNLSPTLISPLDMQAIIANSSKCWPKKDGNFALVIQKMSMKAEASRTPDTDTYCSFA